MGNYTVDAYVLYELKQFISNFRRGIGLKKIYKIILITIGSIIGLFIIFLFFCNIFGKGKLILPVKQKEVFEDKNISTFPSRLSVKDNYIIDAIGKTISLKGLMAPDPQTLEDDNNFKEAFYQKIFAAGGNVIRVPIYPDKWIDDKYYLWRYLDPVVSWAGENNNYVIIDLHFIGNIMTGDGDEMPKINENPKEFAIKFWRKMARYYKDVPNVIFEIYNEPALISSQDWYKCADEIVSAIRNEGAEQLIIVGGIDYSYNLSWVKDTPINDNNIAYTTHVYPSKENWDYNFGDISKEYPVIVTEWGFMDKSDSTKLNQLYLVGDVESFGEPFLEYLKINNIGWIACWYDDTWEPPLFTKDFKDTTNYGKFVFSNLK